MIIGLTGEYCAGKNHVAALLEQRGFEVLDVDRLGHVATEQEQARIVALFGDDILGPDGKIDRKTLGKEVFGRPDRLAALESIIHPAANALAEDWVAMRTGKNLVINAALLHRTTLIERLDFIILVKAGLLTRLIRGKRRDRLSFRALLKRFSSQKHFESQYFQRNSDIHKVYNRGAFAPCAWLHGRSLGTRIDSILTREGMVQQPWNRKSSCS